MSFRNFNSPFWDFFDSINGEVEQFNRLLASHGYDDENRIRINPTTSKSRTISQDDSKDINKSNKPITKHKGNEPINSLTFPNFFGPSTNISPWSLSNYNNNNSSSIIPAVDVLDKKNKYELHFSIPGAKKDDINLDFNPKTNEITVNGIIPEHEEDLDLSNMTIHERSTGNFSRSVKLPSNTKLDETKIKANYDNGVLILNLPKLKTDDDVSKTHRIEILSNESSSDIVEDITDKDSKKSE
ncbi:hypothetical protein WICMUC_004315 [Wickerhamomyces mucosus]|uniref:SHSP domain-containing protein n=1 Tax=Wickerhamomyces mucosus TaxID=1378264 RepID=A0A9P8PHB5_9ASCO|nr:hypothetical protein WICMUC_004315 [Wickerhamomyces mucosus]